MYVSKIVVFVSEEQFVQFLKKEYWNRSYNLNKDSYMCFIENFNLLEMMFEFDFRIGKYVTTFPRFLHSVDFAVYYESSMQNIKLFIAIALVAICQAVSCLC